MSDDTPTQRYEVQEDLKEEKQKSRGLMIGLIAAAGLLIATLIVLVIILLPKGTETPQAGNTDSPAPGVSDTPTPEPTVSDAPTPSAAPTPTEDAAPPPPPPATGAAFTSFNPKTEVSCSRGGPGFTPDPPSIQISWASVRTQSAWIVGGTGDAADSRFMEIPTSGNQGNFEYALQFPCFQASQKWTITLVGTDGKHVSKTWTVKNIGDKD